MTPRQRMLTAIGHGIPDRVPVCPDISNMIPCRLTGKPFWEIYAEQDPPLAQAYLDAVDYYGFDGWFIYHNPACSNDRIITKCRWLEQTDERWIKETVITTPQGDLTSVEVLPRDNPPSQLERLIKNPREDLPKLFALWEFDHVETTAFTQARADVGERGVFGSTLMPPGFHIWEGYFAGGLETLSALMVDDPDILDELFARHMERIRAELPYHLALQPDFILTGGSGGITLSSPTLWRRYALPALQEITRAAKAAGIRTMVHNCGKSRYLVEACATETDLDCINPLEIAPMGDCDLRDIKQRFGQRLALMGNLHTTEVMLRGTVDEVTTAARQAIDAAADGGGFILSTGDQCGRDTPDANIFALLETAAQYGRYYKSA